MLLKDIELRLFKGMNAKFIQMGFSYLKSESCYQIKFEGNLQKVYFIFHKKVDGIYIQPRWSIKIKPILDIYHLVSTKEKKSFKYTPVLENSLGELIEYTDNGNETGSGKLMSYLIESENDIDILINVIPKRIDEYFVPFYKKHSSVKSIDFLLNTNPREMSILCWLYPQKACMGLIAAKLVDNPMYNELENL